MSLFFDPTAESSIEWLSVAGTIASFEAADADELEIRLAFGAPAVELTAVAARSYLREANANANARATFDADGSGDVSTDEIEDHVWVRSTLSSPDLDLFDGSGRYAPGLDQGEDSTSFALIIRAVATEIEGGALDMGSDQALVANADAPAEKP